MKRIIVTGATGFIGVHLINEWLKEDVEVYAVVRPNSKNINLIPKSDRVHVVECDMADIDNIYNSVNRADMFYHLAWEGARLPYRDDENIQNNNYLCSIKAMNVAIKMGCKFFLGSGSQAEYGSTSGIVDEEYPCNPNTAYGKAKLHTYFDLKQMAETNSIRFIWTRIFSVYGQYDYSGTLVMSAIEKMKRNESIDMTAATQLWDYLNVEDAARAMRLFADNECESGVYILASGDYKPLREYVEIIKEVVNSKSELNFGAIPYGPNGPVNLTPCADKVKNVLGWNTKIKFEEGIKRIICNE